MNTLKNLIKIHRLVNKLQRRVNVWINSNNPQMRPWEKLVNISNSMFFIKQHIFSMSYENI
jgi:hypothetical protein